MKLRDELRSAELAVYEKLLGIMEKRKESEFIALKEPFKGKVEDEEIIGIDPSKESVVVHNDSEGISRVELAVFEESNGAWDMIEIIENLPEED